MWLLDKMLRKLIRHGRLVVTDHDGKVYTYGPGDGEEIAIRLTDRKAALDIAKNPRMGAGEAYTDGRLVIEPPHDVRDFVLFVMGQANRHGGLDRPKGPLKRTLSRAADSLGRINTRRHASANVVHHYGLTRRFYELFLDTGRQYSMAYYRDPESSLERAQIDKKALVAAKLRLGLKPDGSPMRLLDIGCGWGGLGLYFHRHFGCEVLGVSLAPDQVKFANERAEAEGVADKVKFQLIDYRDVEGPFDRISSVGMFEHVGARHYDEYFAKTRDLLADDGVMLTHTIGRQGPPSTDDPWSLKYIFPGHHLPAMSEMVAAMERTGWEVADLEVLRLHYALTLQEWYRRAKLHEAEIVELYDERLLRMWQFYLVGAEQSFRTGNMVNFQVQSIKQRDALPMSRDYIVHETARLSALEAAPAWHLQPADQEAAE